MCFIKVILPSTLRSLKLFLAVSSSECLIFDNTQRSPTSFFVGYSLDQFTFGPFRGLFRTTEEQLQFGPLISGIIGTRPETEHGVFRTTGGQSNPRSHCNVTSYNSVTLQNQTLGVLAADGLTY